MRRDENKEEEKNSTNQNSLALDNAVIRYRFSKLNGKRNTNEIRTKSEEKCSNGSKKRARSTEAHERELWALKKKS